MLARNKAVKADKAVKVDKDVKVKDKDSNIYSPYLITSLYTTVSLHPSQMDNKIYIHLKNNLINKLEKRCYSNFGYIVEIYKILDYKDGVIEPENLIGSATFDVTFSCKLCLPIRGKTVTCQVNRVNKLLITMTNGAIFCIVTNERINDKIFFTDNNGYLRYNKTVVIDNDDDSKVDGKVGDSKADNKVKNKKPTVTNVSEVLKPNDFVRVIIDSITFNNGDDNIKIIGFLDNIATDKEIEAYYKDMYTNESSKKENKEDKEEVVTVNPEVTKIIEQE